MDAERGAGSAPSAIIGSAFVFFFAFPRATRQPTQSHRPSRPPRWRPHPPSIHTPRPFERALLQRSLRRCSKPPARNACPRAETVLGNSSNVAADATRHPAPHPPTLPHPPHPPTLPHPPHPASCPHILPFILREAHGHRLPTERFEPGDVLFAVFSFLHDDDPGYPGFENPPRRSSAPTPASRRLDGA